MATTVNLRPDFEEQRAFNGEQRSAERLVIHYVLERELSDRLRHAAKNDRAMLYSELYQQLYSTLPDHPQHQPRAPGDVSGRLRCIARYLDKYSVFLEIGCGDAALAFAVSKRVATAYGVDVTDVLIDLAIAPDNFFFVFTKGITIEVPNNTVDFAYSNQLAEHLHPDDMIDQLKEVYRVLKPGGRYLCITPNRLTGPHDISCYFDCAATCFHLKEYDSTTLGNLFSRVGFRGFLCMAFLKGRPIRIPYQMLRAAERCLSALPPASRANAARTKPVRTLMGLNMIAIK